MEKIIKNPNREKRDGWIGKQLLKYADIEEAFGDFEANEGERLFVKDRNGRVMEILGARFSPSQPVVKYIEWRNIGTDEEEDIQGELQYPEFLAENPVVIDPDDEAAI